MPPSDSAGPADFGTAFTALLAAAGLTVDGVLSALPPGRRGRVSRSTLYDWKKGEHLPLDATGPLLEVVRVCLDAARELGAGLAVWPASEEGWRWLLAEAKQARDADIAQARHSKAGEPGSAWDKRPIGRQDPVSLGMPEVLRTGPPPGGGVFVGRADELAVLEAAAAEARGGRPKVVLVEGEAGIGKSALLARFAAGLADAAVLRASGDEAERLVPYGIVAQLVASARGAGGSPPGLLASELNGAVDPLAVGAELVIWLGQVCCGQKMVLACIDDLQWADGPSARALLFAVRRLYVDQVLVGYDGWWCCRRGRGNCPGWGRAGPGSRPGTTGPAGLSWAGWNPKMWWHWAGRWGPGSCRAAPSAACSSTPAATRCTSGRCWKSPGPRAWMGPTER